MAPPPRRRVRSWIALTTPPAYPFTSFAASSDGRALPVGSPDGIFRSDDQGRSWRQLPFDDEVFAIAVSADGEDIAVVTRQTELFRSDDGGASWPGPNAGP